MSISIDVLHTPSSEIPSTLDLIERAQRGDDSAVAELVQQYFDPIVHVARARLCRRLMRRVDPDDVAQSVCRTFFRRLRRGDFVFQDCQAVWGLLCRITISKSCSLVHHHAAAKRDFRRESSPRAETHPEANPIGELDAPAISPIDVAILVEELEIVLNHYSPTHRRMLNALLIGRSISEVASAEGYSERSVQRTLERLRVDLQRRLEYPTD